LRIRSNWAGSDAAQDNSPFSSEIIGDRRLEIVRGVTAQGIICNVETELAGMKAF
jgi:hypothetical protein